MIIILLVVISAVGICVVIAIFYLKRERSRARNITTFITNIILYAKKKFRTSQPTGDSSKIVCERNAAYAVSKSHIRSDTITAPDYLQTDTNCKDYYSYPREGIDFY